MDRILTSRQGPLLAGGVLGAVAALLVYWGNPGNMGFCVACFTRDVAGALGLHRAGVVQYVRPEIPGFILGSFVSALAFREYAPRSGSSPIVRFFLGICAMFGALVFLGCPWRAYLRLAGGDWNALYGIAGLAVGALVGIAFLWNGFSLGASERNPKAAGLVMPFLALVLLAFVFLKPLFGPGGTGPIFFSKEGPGSQHAPILISLAAGLIVGWLAQRSRFCTVGALRDLFMMGDAHLFGGLVSFVVVAFAVNFVLGQFHPGFEKQPVAHTQELWNFLGMVLSGLAFTLAGGCPGRQLIMAGEGDGDAGTFVVGMLVGAALAHNFSAASSGAGVGPWGIPVTIGGLVVCALIGLGCRTKQA
ncbi:MAG: YedE-related selenium metabolism membrane protein [Synergistaceae bacterium]|jgi:YedE family putative selenium metabolism protein|nr:YedE-related selenium metabolism membrane protein [Synergistaceae bacterium]